MLEVNAAVSMHTARGVHINHTALLKQTQQAAHAVQD